MKRTVPTRMERQRFVVEWPRPTPIPEGAEPRIDDASIVRSLTAGLSTRLYVDGDGRRLKPRWAHPAYRGDHKHMAAATFYPSGEESWTPLDFEIWRVAPTDWRERGIRRNRPDRVAELCIGALSRLGCQVEEGVFGIGPVEVDEHTLQDALSSVPQLQARPPEPSGPGCAADTVGVAIGIINTMGEVFGRPAGVICQLAYPLCREYMLPVPAAEATI
jgi:hypothetical protein